MKLKLTLWLLAFLACSALALWQKDNLSTFCREYYSFWRVYEYHQGGFIPKKLLIPSQIAQTDPEAAAVLESIIHWYGENEPLISIAQYLEKFPQNEKFLSDFVFWLSEEKALDPQIQLMTTEKLLHLHPENALYQYLLADSLLALRNDNDINKALEAIEKANRCSDFNMPYDKYKQRVIDLAEKAKLGQMIITTLNYEGPGPDTGNLRKLPLAFANAAFTDGDYNLGTRICDTIHNMQRKQFMAGSRWQQASRNLNLMSSPIHFGSWRYPEALELQRAAISNQRARELRLRLCAWIPDFLLLDDSQRAYTKTEPEINQGQKADWADLAIFLSPHFGRMFLSMVLTLFVFALLCLLFGYSRNDKIGFFKISLFAFACFCFFVLASRLFIVLLDNYCCNGRYSLSAIRMPVVQFSMLLDVTPVATIFFAVPFVCLILLYWAKIRPAAGKWFVRWSKRLLLSGAFASGWIGLLAVSKLFCDSRLQPEDLILPFIIVAVATILISGLSRWFCRWRICWLIPVAVLLGSFSIMAEGYFYIGYLVMILFIIFSVLIIVGPASSGAFHTRCLKLVSPFIIVYWLIFVALMPLSAYRISYDVKLSSPAKRSVTLFEPNEAVYQRVLARFDSNQITKHEAFRFIGLIMPEELSHTLIKYYKLSSGLDERVYLPLIGKTPDHSEFISCQNDQNELFLIRAVTSSGKDSTSILTKAMNDPNHPRALMARAQLGDVTAKQPLKAILAKHIEQDNESLRSEGINKWRDIPPKSYEIIAALACISEPNDAAQHYINYIQRHSVPDLLYDFDLLRSANLLPSQQARIVIKAYLEKVKQWNPSQQPHWDLEPDAALQPLRSIVGIYGDKEIAEAVLEFMLQNAAQNTLFDVSPYFTSESAELLKKGLSSDNDRFRAWSVWQLRKVGYQFTQDEINKLMRDESWMVRANAAIAAPQLTKDLAKNDKNPFIRFASSLNN